jgi:peptidoglycan/xylan/chitin deacetylase (PgdA/CDA1 family)
MSARHAVWLLAVGCAAPVPSLRLDTIATWRGDATAAYSITHDDVCADRVRGVFTQADPLLTSRGLHAGFAAIAGECEQKGLWPQVDVLRAHGHDVFSHTLDHPCLTNDPKVAAGCDPAAPRSTDFAREIDRAAELLAAHGVGRDLFIIPYDACDVAAVAWLERRGYLGARCGGHGIMPPDFTDSFHIDYDVWGPAYSGYGKAPVCRGVVPFETPPAQAPAACRAHVLRQLVDDAIGRKGWGNRVFHGFEGDPGVWEALPLADYTAHLDQVKALAEAGTLWVAGPSTVLRYRWARERCAPPSIAASTLRFAPTPACARVATTLSYLVSTVDGADRPLQVLQAGSWSPVRRIGPGRFIVDADPTRGDAVVMAR